MIRAVARHLSNPASAWLEGCATGNASALFRTLRQAQKNLKKSNFHILPGFRAAKMLDA
jgi:hypothetical protein